MGFHLNTEKIAMTLKIGVLMDAIETIKPYKDTTFAMMLAALARGHQLFYFQTSDLSVQAGKAYARAATVSVKDVAKGEEKRQDYYTLGEAKQTALADFDVILMRKDPPFDMEYIYATYVLDLAEEAGVLVANPPKALRNVNEKFSTTRFPKLTPKTLVTRDIAAIRAFVAEEKHCVIKPLDGMGGAGIFRLNAEDKNMNAILEALGSGKHTLMVQRYLEAVTEGDKRILLIDGEPSEHGLARIPQGNEFRANLAAGGVGVVQPLTAREREICAAVKPFVKAQGLLFVGLDVIDGHLTEINVTSPTCVREIEAATDERLADKFIQVLEKRVQAMEKEK